MFDLKMNKDVRNMSEYKKKLEYQIAKVNEILLDWSKWASDLIPEERVELIKGIQKLRKLKLEFIEELKKL